MFPHIQHLYSQEHSPGGAARSMYGDLFDNLRQQSTFTSDTTGLANDIAGLVLYNQVNMKNRILGVLPQIDRTGEENVSPGDTPAKTFRAIFNPPSISGIQGGGQVPDAVSADVRRAAADVRISSMAIESDIVVDIESRLGHDTLGLDDLVDVHRDYMDRSIERDALAVPVASGDGGYQDQDLLTSLDRVIASSDEETNAMDTTGSAYNDGDLDVYDIDRSSTGAGADNEANWADADVDHNSGTLRQLNSDLMNTFLDNHFQNSSAERENSVIVTGYDSARVLSDLRESQFRADALQQGTRDDVNDAETRMGANFNARISHWDGIPVVVAETMPTDDLSRVFLMDITEGQVAEDGNPRPKIGIENYRAPDVWRAGVDADVNPLATGEFKNEALFAMYHEVVCRDFGAQGKLRDLEE